LRVKELAKYLWEVLVNLLTPQEFVALRPYGFGNEGFWRPICINECMRIVKYQAGDHFMPHKDGAFILNEDIRSALTLMIYLNEGYEGGETVFFDESNSKTNPRKIEVLGITGKGLIFTQDVTHSGEPLQGKIPKYILRTDIMFQRISGSKGTTSLLKNPNFLLMDSLYKEAVALQKKGDAKGSTEKYLAAQKIQAEMPSVDQQAQEMSASVSLQWPLGLDLSLLIFECMTIGELVKCARVCKGWNWLAKHPSIWRKLYTKRWPLAAKMELMMEPLNVPHLIDYSRPWKDSYRMRAEADEKFKVVYFDIGSQKSRFGMVGEADDNKKPESYYMYSHYPPDQPALDPPEIHSLVARVKGHYWSAREGLEDYVVGFSALNSYYNVYRMRGPYRRATEDALKEAGIVANSEIATESYRDSGTKLSDPALSSDGSAIIYWDAIRNIMKYLFSVGFGTAQPVAKHPVLFATPHFFQARELRMLEYVLHRDIRTPAYTFIPASILNLISVDQKTGVVVSSGHLFTSITPIIDGQIVEGCQFSFPFAGAQMEPYLGKKMDSQPLLLEPKLMAKVKEFFFPEEDLEALARQYRDDQNYLLGADQSTSSQGKKSNQGNQENEGNNDQSQPPPPSIPTSKNLATLTYLSVMLCPESQREAIFKTVVLTGGNSFVLESIFIDQLKKVSKSFKYSTNPVAKGYYPHVVIPEDRLYSVNHGARIYCSLSKVKSLFRELPATPFEMGKS